MAEETSRENHIQHLQSAFHTFNSLSEQLATSYRQLQDHVQALSHQLSAAELENHQQCLATERLARRHARLLEALPGGVVVLDGQGIVKECNPAAVELLGEPLSGQSWLTVIRRAFAPRSDDGHDVSLKDGRRLNISTNALNCEPGQILLLKDVTETRRLQDTLARHQRLAGMGQIAAALAHQVRTPVSCALLYVAQLTASIGDASRVNRCADKIRAQLQHVEQMVRDMLAVLRGEGETCALESLTMPVLLERLAQLATPLIDNRGGVLTVRDDTQDAVFQGNSTALLGALSNLIINALQACTDTPRIDITARLDAETVLIEVADNGPGIPNHLRQTLFQPFVTGQPQGTGLGLAVVQNVVSRHGGGIDFTSEPGQGTVFVVRLPLPCSNVEGEEKSVCSTLNESQG